MSEKQGLDRCYTRGYIEDSTGGCTGTPACRRCEPDRGYIRGYVEGYIEDYIKGLYRGLYKGLYRGLYRAHLHVDGVSQRDRIHRPVDTPRGPRPTHLIPPAPAPPKGRRLH